MSKYIKLEDAIKAYNQAVTNLVESEMEEFELNDFTECQFDTTQIKLIARMIASLPSIDIVRCEDCKWADWYKTAEGEQFCYCMKTGNGGRTADDFCSYGERIGNE